MADKTKDISIKLIITDMDGTFLNSASSVPSQNAQTIKKLREKHIPVIFCTGRPVSIVDEYIRQSGASAIVIGCNGAVIQDTTSGKVLYGKFFKKNTVKKIVDFCLSKRMDCLAYTDTGDVFFSDTSERVNIFRNYNIRAVQGKSTPVSLFPMESEKQRLFSMKISKVLVTGNSDEDLPHTWRFLENIKDICAVPSMQNVIDIMTKGVSKGKAVKKTAQLLHIPLSEICVVGDNKNDISMFKTVPMAVCMANGDKEAKKFAKYVTKKTNDEGGSLEAGSYAIGKYIQQATGEINET